MLLIPMTLQNISELNSPSERVPLDESTHYEAALHLIAENGFEGYELQPTPSEFPGLLLLQMYFKNPNSPKHILVNVTEDRPHGPLHFSCSHCLKAGRTVQTCPHQWAAFVVLWQSVVKVKEQILHGEVYRLSKVLKGPQFLGAVDDPKARYAKYENVTLDSMSLFLDEPPLLKGDPLSTHLNEDLGKYEYHEVAKEEEHLSPRLWNLPEVFRKKIMAYSGHYFNEVNQQARITEMVRYNFSNGQQITAKEILRHPLQKKVPGELLPQGKSAQPLFAPWPLLQQTDNLFVSPGLAELEEIMKALLSSITTLHSKGKIDLFLQTKNSPGRAMRLSSVEFDPVQELDWRVEFKEGKELEAEFALTSFRKQPLYFFHSFAVEPKDKVVIVHPWLRELSGLQETLSKISNDLFIGDRRMPLVDVTGELEAKSILNYLRGRTIPVKISGESRTLGSHQSQTEIRLDEGGNFYVQHEARVAGQKNLVRKGWTTKSALFLQTLSQGLPYLLSVEAKEIATRNRTKREWDIKLLKHFGILQYIFFESLSLHFEGTLSDGTTVPKDKVFESLHEKIQVLLIAGSPGLFVRDLTLNELCSKSVLACFDDFVAMTFKAMDGSEAFYSENGEVVMEGLIEREFRLLFEMLKKMVLTTNGEVFRKSRTPLLAKIYAGDFLKEADLTAGQFHFSGGDGQKTSSLHDALDSLQALIPHGFKIYYKDQPLQELTDDEFHVDFLVTSESDQKLFNWFELNPKFFLRGEEVDPENFLSLGGGGVVEYDGKLYLVPKKQLPSLRRLEKFWQKLQKGKSETTKRNRGEKIYQLPRHQTLELLALRSSGVAIRGDHEWQKLCDFYDGLGTKTRELSLPKSITGQLKPYQALGVQWLQDLYNLKLGALLADDMGLGKTLQTLSFLDDLRDKGELGQVLIIVPSSLIFNWQQEIEKFTPELPVCVFTNKDKDSIGNRIGLKQDLVVIATYGLLMEHENFLNQYPWKVLIFDEAQNLKNITTKRTSAARSLNAQFKICLTGTPMENHFGEFYSLVDILVPGSLGRIDEFRKQFVNTEMVSREQMDDLKLKIKPLLLRRTKKEIMDQLPEKQETKVSIAFEDRQKEIYRDIALSYNQRVQETIAVQGESSVQLQMLTALLRLRQACSDPAALPNVKYDKVPPKLETLLDSLQEIVESGESALVFTQFLQTLEHTATLLRNANIPVFVLHGGVPTKQRQKILQDFGLVPGGAVLLMTLKTGGVGLNLTKASYVFHLEPWWNPSVENQATDRAHRLGQTKAVQVFRYIMHESLEEKIELLKDRKDRKFQALFTSTEKEVDLGEGSAALSKADFDLLLGLK